jgi:hypothetical protein
MEQRLKLLKLGSNWCSKIMILNKLVVLSILNLVPASETFCSDWTVGSAIVVSSDVLSTEKEHLQIFCMQLVNMHVMDIHTEK